MDENWGAYLPSSQAVEYPNWYEFKGGSDAYNNPDATDPIGLAYNVSPLATQLIPQEEVESDPGKFSALLADLILSGNLSPIYFLGGAKQSVPSYDTAMHPAALKAVFNLGTSASAGAQKVRDAYPNNITGVCFNHHSAEED
jgi:hypothetical protein